MRALLPCTAPALRGGALALGLFAAVCSAAHAQAPASPAGQADDADAEARAHAKSFFEMGVAAYDSGRYEEALSSFQEAFRIRPHPLVRVNIANCYDKLGKPLEALFHFEQFTAADVGTPEQRKEVAAAIERLRKQIGQVVVRVTPDGALVTIDKGEQRRTPIVDPISLTAGKHELEVRLDGYQPVQRSLNVRGGTTTELNVVLARTKDAVAAAPAPVPALQPEAATSASPAVPGPEPAEATPVPAPEPAQPEPEASGGLPAGVWILGGVSAGLLLAGTVTGLLALDAESDFDQAVRAKLDPNATPLERLDAYQRALDASDRADGLALTTDILLLAGVAGAVVTTVLALNAGDDAETTARVTPALGPRTAGATVSARF